MLWKFPSKLKPDQSAAVAIWDTWPRFKMPSSKLHPSKTRAIRFSPRSTPSNVHSAASLP